ncbi:MAG: aspartate aminotransferase family protein [Spirochaetales bacterium]|jgi:acetylornithine/N-succinyldiaminopimelate aminotransferase|nr:aspartate aminotransferase family protein [Spirochaetales bacterium]
MSNSPTNGNAKTEAHPFPNCFSAEMLVLEKGSGVYIEDIAGKTYLDFGSGISVNALGYGRTDLADAASEQMAKLIHISNLYATPPSIDLGNRLLKLGNFSAVQFGNSGSEANEAAIKFSRLYSLRKKGEGNHRLLCFNNAFHGRTMGALSCTPTAKYQEPFAPLVPGVSVCDFNDSKQVEELLDETFAAVLVEVVQGEGGMNVMTPEFVETLNTLCRKYDIMLIADEVQTGLGRCGKALASDAVGLVPDIVTIAKPLAGGLPLSATLIPAKIDKELIPGHHGTTFGGGPVTTAVAGKVLDVVLDEAFLAELEENAAYLESRLQEIAQKNPGITGVKGLGMLKGLEIDPARADKLPEIMAALQADGLLILRSGVSVLRIAPPLVISKEELKKGLSMIEETCLKILA